MQQESGLKTWQWVVTAIVVVALIIIGVIVFTKDGNSDKKLDEDPTTTSATTTSVGTIIVGDQYPGNVVYISSLDLSSPAWVVIHRDDNGKPGKVIGEKWVTAGIQPVRITTSEPIIDGQAYYVMIHTENGDLKFDEATDLPLKDQKGNVLMKIFRGSSSVSNDIKG